MSEITPEQELLNQLKTDKRSIKIQAIVKLSRIGKTEATLQEIVPIMNSDDRELSFFAAQAASKICNKLGIDLNEYIGKHNLSAPSQPKGILNRESFLNPSKEKIPELLRLIRNEPKKISQSLLPAVGAFLTRHGSVDDSEFIKSQLLTDNSNLSLPFLNAAESIAPGVLLEVLPNLLASGECLVRSRAICALQKIDAVEAERHFADLLASRNAENRLAGLGIAMLFPYNRVKDYLITLLTEEKDRDVIEACQTVLVSNPELETALGILDKVDTVASDQRNVLSHVFKYVCKAMAVVGIMSKEEADPNRILELWKEQRLQSFLNDLEVQLSFADSNKKEAIINWIEKNKKHPKVEALIKKLEHNPQTEDIYRKLNNLPSLAEEGLQTYNLSDISSDNELNSRNESIPTDKPASKNDEETIKTLKSIDLENIAQYKTWVTELAQDETDSNSSLKAEAINTMVRAMRGNRLIDIAKEGLRSKHEEVRLASFKALERTNPDYLNENLSILLKEESENLRVRIIRFAIKYDEAEAIKGLKHLLSSEDKNMRSNAVSCLGLCSFAHTAKLLTKQLEKEDHPVIAKQITSIILSNPSKGLLDAIDQLSANSSPAVSMVISQARNDLADIVEKLPETFVQEKGIEESILDAVEKKQTEKPYSVANVRALAKQNKEQHKEKKEINVSLIISALIVVLVIIGLPIMIMNMPEKEEKPLKGKKSNKLSERIHAKKSGVPNKFRMNRACSITGTVEIALSDTTIIVIHEQSKINVKFDNGLPLSVKANDRVKLTIVPYKTNPQGIIMARGQKLEKEAL